MANPLKLPFDFAPNATPPTHQLQANFNALLQFVQDLNDAVISLSNLLVGTLQTTSTATIGGALAANSTAIVTGVLTASNDVIASTIVKLANGSANSPSLQFSNSSGSGIYRAGSSIVGVSTGGVQAWQADANSNITQPLQPAFLVQRIAVSGNSHTGNQDPFVFDTESYDIGNNFTTNVFTAPVTGKYFFAYSINLGPRAGTPATSFNIKLVTTNQSFPLFVEAPVVDETFTFSTIANMTAGDTAKATVTVTGSATWVSEVDANSYFMGTLIN